MKLFLVDKEDIVSYQCYLIDEDSFLSFCTILGNVASYDIFNYIREKVKNKELLSLSLEHKENSLEENIVNIKDFSVELIFIAEKTVESLLPKEYEYFIYTLAKFLDLALETKSKILLSSSYEIH